MLVLLPDSDIIYYLLSWSTRLHKYSITLGQDCYIAPGTQPWVCRPGAPRGGVTWHKPSAVCSYGLSHTHRTHMAQHHHIYKRVLLKMRSQGASGSVVIQYYQSISITSAVRWAIIDVVGTGEWLQNQQEHVIIIVGEARAGIVVQAGCVGHHMFMFEHTLVAGPLWSAYGYDRVWWNKSVLCAFCMGHAMIENCAQDWHLIIWSCMICLWLC